MTLKQRSDAKMMGDHHASVLLLIQKIQVKQQLCLSCIVFENRLLSMASGVEEIMLPACVCLSWCLSVYEGVCTCCYFVKFVSQGELSNARMTGNSRWCLFWKMQPQITAIHNMKNTVRMPPASQCISTIRALIYASFLFI